MKLKRLYLRYSLNFQKLKIKFRNLEVQDFQDAYIIISRRLYRIIHLRNLVVFSLVFIIFVTSMFISSFKGIEAYYNKDKPLTGGTYTEGKMGKFLRLNPIYSQTNQNDEDAINLLFSGLMKHDDGKGLKTDLASKWALSEDRKAYDFEIKEGVKWHDGTDFSADDVVFTVQTVQNPDARSPLYEAWKGVKVEKTGDNSVRFTLKEPNEAFLENTTLKIIPKHILGEMPTASIQTVDFNVEPVGTGPYAFESLAKESGRETLILDMNDYYYGTKPYLKKVVLEGFLDEGELLDEYSKKNIDGIGDPTQEMVERFLDTKGTSIHEYTLPRYIAAFFNMDNDFLKEKNLRISIGLATDRKEILNSSADGRGLVVSSPISDGSAEDSASRDVGKATEMLKAAGYVTEGGQLKYKGKDVSLKIVTGDTGELKKTAETFQKNLEALGIKSEIMSVNMNSLQNDFIRPRDYDILIIGENTGLYPDLFSFWHSSQITDPGLNFSKYKDRKLDKFLEIVRKTTDQKQKQEKLAEIQKIITGEAAAVYLFNPYYSFIVSDNIKGIEGGKIISPSDRFLQIQDWYTKADRVPIDE